MKVVVIALNAELPQDLPAGYRKLVTGVGKVNASVSLTKFLLLHPDTTEVINYGTAGGVISLRRKLVRVDGFIQRDMNCSLIGSENYVTYGETERVIHTANASAVDQIFCGTGDCFSVPTDDYQLVDMEGYALAKAAQRMGIRFESYKYVSDGGDPEEWSDNVTSGSEQFLKLLQPA